jgi:hypothetical protein
MCACSEAFHSLRPCAIFVVGVAGSMPAHGIGTACFVATACGKEYVIKIHNCLLCHGEDRFNLLSVSQTLRTKRNDITFRANGSMLQVMESEDVREKTSFALRENDGLYELEVSPLFIDDPRLDSLPSVELTLQDEDPRLWDNSGKSNGFMTQKAPTRLGVWHCKVLWISRKIGMQEIKHDYDEHLNEFCESYLVPPSQPAARRTYRSGEKSDMAELSLRFMGIGTDRLDQTLKRSRGLVPPSKEKGENKPIVPPLNFPQGKWKAGKTPRVAKGKVENLHQVSIAEICFTDTFETKDTKYRYGQVFVDYRSRYGDVFPIRSRKKVGWAFGSSAAVTLSL